jgi:hypothetical protein
MKTEKLKVVVEFAQSLGHVFVATADQNGLPHLAAAKELSLEEDGLIGVAAWFCPGTVSNLQVNNNISIVVWNPANDRGYQLLGKLERMEELAVMDGYAPELEEVPLPQVERKIIVRLDKILDFRHAPHSDIEAK